MLYSVMISYDSFRIDDTRTNTYTYDIFGYKWCSHFLVFTPFVYFSKQSRLFTLFFRRRLVSQANMSWNNFDWLIALQKMNGSSSCVGHYFTGNKWGGSIGIMLSSSIRPFLWLSTSIRTLIFIFLLLSFNRYDISHYAVCVYMCMAMFQMPLNYALFETRFWMLQASLFCFCVYTDTRRTPLIYCALWIDPHFTLQLNTLWFSCSLYSRCIYLQLVLFLVSTTSTRAQLVSNYARIFTLPIQN